MDPLAADPLQIAGLPLHPLIVHVIVIVTPLTVLAVLLGAFWPAARRRLGVVTPLAAAVVLILVPVTTAAGESLKEIVGPLPAVERHEALGRMLLPWAIALFVVALAQWLWFRFGRERLAVAPADGARPAPAARGITIGLGALAVIVGAGTLIVLVLIGDSGARAVWGGLLGG